MSPLGLDDQVALFAAPLSTPFLAVAALLFDGMEHRYARFAAEVRWIGPWAAQASATPWTVLALPPGAGEVASPWRVMSRVAGHCRSLMTRP